MKFISRNGMVIRYRQPRVARRAIQFNIKDPGSWSEEPFLRIIWETAGFLVKRVTLKERYRTAEGVLSHNYELIIRVGRGFAVETRQDVNALITKIELATEAKLDVELRRKHEQTTAV